MVAIRGVSCGIFAFWHSPPPHALRPSEAVCIRRRLPNPHVIDIVIPLAQELMGAAMPILRCAQICR